MRVGLLGGAGYANDGRAGYFLIFLHKVFPRTTKTTIVFEFLYSVQRLTQLNILQPLLDVDLNHWQQYLFRYVFYQIPTSIDSSVQSLSPSHIHV